MADAYQDGAGSGSAEKPRDADALFSKLQKWFKADFDSKGQTT
jgi:hypothetical protein